eukprot:219239-Hanusia_phi.AAC.3
MATYLADKVVVYEVRGGDEQEDAGKEGGRAGEGRGREGSGSRRREGAGGRWGRRSDIFLQGTPGVDCTAGPPESKTCSFPPPPPFSSSSSSSVSVFLLLLLLRLRFPPPPPPSPTLPSPSIDYHVARHHLPTRPRKLQAENQQGTRRRGGGGGEQQQQQQQQQQAVRNPTNDPLLSLQGESQKDVEQKRAGTFFYMDDSYSQLQFSAPRSTQQSIMFAIHSHRAEG